MLKNKLAIDVRVL